jgi:hypothetical protein
MLEMLDGSISSIEGVLFDWEVVNILTSLINKIRYFLLFT